MSHKSENSSQSRVARLKNEVRAKYFSELRSFSRKMLRKFPPKAFVLWVRKNPAKFPPNLPQHFPAKKFFKITDELLQERREKIFSQNIATSFRKVGHCFEQSSHYYQEARHYFGKLATFFHFKKVTKNLATVFHVNGWGGEARYVPRSPVNPNFWAGRPGILAGISQICTYCRGQNDYKKSLQKMVFRSS